MQLTRWFGIRFKRLKTDKWSYLHKLNYLEALTKQEELRKKLYLAEIFEENNLRK